MSEARDHLREEALHRLLAVARQLGASPDLRAILAVIIDAMRDLLGAERATVFEYDARRDELFASVAHGLSEDGGAPAGEIRFSTVAGLAGASARTRAIINVADAHEDLRFNPEVDRRTGFRTRSLLTIPLVSFEGDLVGVAQVLNKRGGPFDHADEEIAAALAAHAAVALKRGRLLEDRVQREQIERDLQLARQIQQGSLPRALPHLPGFDLAAWSEPADQTGGDSYDVIGFPPAAAQTPAAESDGGEAERALLLLADATGHGIGPALSVTQVRSMLRMAARMNAGLAQIALHVNRQLCHDLPPGRFVTAWLGQLDVPSRTLTSFSAGQGPLLRYRAAEDRFEEVETDTLPLGIDTDLTISIQTRFSMAKGDLFAAISDGIFEAAGPGRAHFGVRRAREVIRAARARPAAQILASLREAVERYTDGREAEDDRTVLLIRRLGP